MLSSKKKVKNNYRAVSVEGLEDIDSSKLGGLLDVDFSLNGGALVVPSGHNMVGSITISGSDQLGTLMTGGSFINCNFIKHEPNELYFGSMDSGLVTFASNDNIDQTVNKKDNDQGVVNDFYSFIKKKAPGPMINPYDFDQ
jgi:hypothetical protein